MRTAVAALVVAIAALSGCSTPERTSSPRFTHMDMALATGNRAKSADTRLEILISPKGGGQPAAYLDVNGQAFAPNTTAHVSVPAAGQGFTLDDLKREQIVLRTTSAWRNTWTCGFDAVLHFDDGSEALLGSGDLALSSGRTEAAVPLSLATVASASALGGVERFAFRVLTKGSVSTAGEPEGGQAGAARYRRANPKEFTHMDLALATGGRGKDADTRLEIFIAPKDGVAPVAYLDVQGQSLEPYSTVSEVVPATGAGFTEGDLRHEQIFVRITPGSGSTWTFGFDAILHFGDGSEALWSTEKMALSGASRLALIPLSSATVAHTSTLGGVERFAFKLLSKGSVTQTAPPPAAASAPGPAQEAPPKQAAVRHVRQTTSTRDFTQMDVTVKTHRRGKDADTRLEFSIVPKDGGSPVAYLDVQGQGLAPDSAVREVVPAVGTSFTLDELKHEQLLVKITPQVRSTWTHGFDIVLHFADGTQALWSTGDLALTDDRNQEFIPLSDATIASPSAIGGLEKFGFGLLNKIGK